MIKLRLPHPIRPKFGHPQFGHPKFGHTVEQTLRLLLLLALLVPVAPRCPAQDQAFEPRVDGTELHDTQGPAEALFNNDASRSGDSAKLTDAERAWIRSNPVRVGLEDWPPIVFSDDEGAAGGLAGGYPMPSTLAPWR